MILRALVQYAENDGLMGASTNFETVPVCWAIQLDRDGVFRELRDIRQEVKRGKKTMLVGQQRSVPLMKGKRTVNVVARFLVDNAKYILAAYEEPKDADRAKDCQRVFRELLEAAAATTGHPSLGRVLKFLADEESIERVRKRLRDEKAASNDLITFDLEGDGRFLDEVPELHQYWDAQMTPAPDSGDSPGTQCLICGRERPTVRLHSNVKGLRDASSSGVPLVTFNKPAFESYGWAQGANAPVCQSCDRAYVTAINRFLSDRFVRPSNPESPLPAQSVYLGASVTAVYWVDKGEAGIARLAYDPDADPDEVKRLLESPGVGKRTALDGLFHCLLLQGAEGRATVKSYSSKTVVEVEKNVRRWFQETATRLYDGPGRKLHAQRLMLKHLTPSGKDDKLPKSWPVDLYLSSLFGFPISPWLAQAAVTRNRMEAKVTDARAALLQSWLARTPMWNERKAIVSLDLECKEPAYRLGRLLAMCDRIQYLAAERRVGRTLSDSFYSSLSSRPMLALGGLMKITKSRAAQLKGGEAAAMIRLGEVLPAPEELARKDRFNLKDQALFALGFYHQRAEDMKKKENKNDEPAQ